ncbi:TetR/AcrR family transcriptional regulator [Maribacter litopenaei]|uniref:TetR/AcrR family transcriptional regulator n=1 Tax=Maribacter litopenaei TaxID=2976127 RepID=A0ABY5Y7L1_9FLAO|nr:TetR/AcrR family transcriptional regulator [Maribacter litopenaei]UWX55015.1 TetR/AcrR family transcriptional regulator [Maribacter litopenaei]
MDKTLKRMATMHRIQTAGLELFYANGYYATSVDDILKKLSLSKGAFYYHFESKEDFFVQIIQNLLSRKVYSSLIEPIEGFNNPLQSITSCFDEARKPPFTMKWTSVACSTISFQNFVVKMKPS